MKVWPFGEFKSKNELQALKDELATVKKSLLRDDNPTLQPDSFYTSLLNSIPVGSLNSSLDLLLYFFNNVSEINSLITYIAQKGADIPVRHVRVLGNGKQKDLGETDLLKKLKKPNHLNDGRAFMINCISSYLVFGFIPINKIAPIGWAEPSEFFLLPGNNFYPIPEKSVNQYGMPPSGTDFRTNRIKQYRLFIDNRPFNFDPEEIIMINDSNLSFDNGAYLKGQSRLYSAIRSIKTLSYIYDTVNTLIANKGAAGFVTKRTKANQMDGNYWDPVDKKNAEDRLYSFGTTEGKRPIFVTSQDLDFKRISVPVSEFQPIELKQHEFRTLATALLFPSVLLNDKEGAIYNNATLAQKAFYTDCLIPIVNIYYESITNGCGLNQVGEKLVADWSSVECLQADKKLQAETTQLSDKVWKDRYESNLITLNEYLTNIGLPNLPNGNMYARDNKDIPLAVRIGVGGTQSLQAILSDPNLTTGQKINIIVVVFGISREEAVLIGGSEKPNNNTQNIADNGNNQA